MNWETLNQRELHDQAMDFVERRFQSVGFRTRRDKQGRLFVRRGDRLEHHVAVIGARSPQYYFVLKKRISGPHAVVALVWVPSGHEPTAFLIPEHSFRAPEPLQRTVLKDRNYEGKKSDPEYGLSLASDGALNILERSFPFAHIASTL